MRNRKLKFLAGAALAAVLGLGVMVIGSKSAFTVHDTELFELEDIDQNDSDDNPAPPNTFVPDANANDGDGDGDDWSNMKDPDPGRIFIPANDHSIVSTGIIHDEGNANANHPDVFSGTGNLKPEDIFTGGGTKDINDLNQWKWKNASGFPDKNDITHAYAAAYNCPDGQSNCTEGDLILYFGADRYTNNGDAFLGFWFFQQAIAQTPGSPAGTFGGNHIARGDNGPGTPGDFLILVDYPQGANADPILRVLEWVNSGGNITTHLEEIFSSLDVGNSAKCGDASPDPVCASTNDFNTPSPWFYAFKGTSTDGPFPHETFYEGGINISDLLGGAQLCLSAFMVETRSSESETATLKDFVLGNFKLCGINVTKECTEAKLNTAGTQVDLKFAGTVENTGALTINVDLVDDPAATFTAVCFDDDATPNSCVGETAPANLSGIGSTNVTFDLNGGDIVRWEATRTVTPPTGGFSSLTFTDTVTAEAFDDGGSSVDLKTADGECTATETLSLVVDKNCSNPQITGGDTFTATISGTVTNNSNVKLLNLEFNDNVFADSALTINGSPGNNGGADLAELAVGASVNFSAQVSTQSATSHVNTLTVLGNSAITNTQTSGFDSSAEDPCSVSPNPRLEVDKNCDTGLAGGNGIELVVDNGKVVVKAGAVITVTNTGNVDLTSVNLGDNKIANLTLQPGSNGFTCGASGCTGSLDLNESATFKGTYFPNVLPGGGPGDPDTTSFTNTATVAGTGALGGLTAQGTTGPADLTDDATCAVCQ